LAVTIVWTWPLGSLVMVITASLSLVASPRVTAVAPDVSPARLTPSGLRPTGRRVASDAQTRSLKSPVPGATVPL
jgi:hypothetical protein